MIKENRIINRESLRKLCINFDLYTLGTNKEYEEMLENAELEEHLTTEKVERKEYVEKTQETIK